MNLRKKMLLHSAIVTGVMSSIVVGVASAQNVEEDQVAKLPTVVVTAQKREQDIKDVPISIIAVSGNNLQDMQVAGLEDLSESLPNVIISEDSVSNNIYVRGVGSGANSGFEQAVATFVDGVYRGRSRYTQSTLVDVAQVEVLRGPQTIYFGNNAIGGAFSVTAAAPNLDNWEGYGLTSYEFEGNESVFEGAVGGPIVEDKLALRIAGRYSKLNGYIENEGTGEDNPKIEDKFLRATLLWQMNDQWSATAKAEYGVQKSVAPFPVQLTNCPPALPFSAAVTFSCGYALATGQESEFDYRRNSSPGERGDIEASEFLVKFERDNSYGHGFVIVASHSKHDFFLGADTDGSPADFFTFSTPEDLDQKTLELRMISPADSKLQYILGAYYLESENNITTTLNFPFATVLLAGPLEPLLSYAPLSGETYLGQKEKAFSGFGAITYPFTDRLSATVGLRYTNSQKEAIQSSTNGTSGDPYGVSFTPLPASLQPVATFLTGFVDHTTAADADVEDWLPSLTLQYEHSDDLSLYAKFSQGFKAGGFDSVELTGVEGRLTYEPETVNAYEAGFKSLLLDRSLSFNLSVFRSEYKDLQQSVSQFTETSAFITVTNVGGLETQGVEAELLWRPVDHWQFGTDLALLDATYQDYANAGCTALQAYQVQLDGGLACFQDLSGESPPFAPNYSGNVRVGFDYPVGSGLEFTADAVLSFSDSYDLIADKDPLTRQDAWQKLDLRLGLGDIDGAWELAFVGKNLTDEKIMGSANDVVASSGSYSRTILRGRTLSIQARYNW